MWVGGDDYKHNKSEKGYEYPLAFNLKQSGNSYAMKNEQ